MNQIALLHIAYIWIDKRAPFKSFDLNLNLSTVKQPTKMKYSYPAWPYFHPFSTLLAILSPFFNSPWPYFQPFSTLLGQYTP